MLYLTLSPRRCKILPIRHDSERQGGLLFVESLAALRQVRPRPGHQRDAEDVRQLGTVRGPRLCLYGIACKENELLPYQRL